MEDSKVTIKTDRTRVRTLDKLIRLIMYEYERKKPEELDSLMASINLRYEFILEDRKPKSERRQLEEPEPLDDFNFWKGLMEKREER
ncbi:hypothetical protein D3C77_623090 [compost metagenome]